MVVAKLLKMENIVKEFPGVKALDNVNFSLEQGQVHGLVGSNGAGKSTLIKVLGGLFNDYRGRIYLNGNLVEVFSPRQAADLGIAIIHQEFSLVPDLTVAENIMLGIEPRKKRVGLSFLDWQGIYEETEQFLNKIGFQLPARAKVSELSVAGQQLVQIAKALICDAKILVMDEPTARLSSSERTELFKIIASLKNQGVGIIYISHFLEEVFMIADQITVLRDGKNIISEPAEKLDHAKVVRAMVGRDLVTNPVEIPTTKGEPILQVKGLTIHDKFQDVSFTLHQGEILGLTGLVGSGRTEVARAVFGLDTPRLKGEMFLHGKPYWPSSPQDAIKRGLALLPEDRKLQGLILIHSVLENLTLTTLQDLTKGSLIDHTKRENLVEQLIEMIEIKTASKKVLANTLSGGNQQKIVLAKWLAAKPDILILDQPTAGIDVGTKAEVYKLIEELVKEGLSLIVISDEPEELARICHRVLIMRKGRVVHELTSRPTSEEVLMGVTAEY